MFWLKSTIVKGLKLKYSNFSSFVDCKFLSLCINFTSIPREQPEKLNSKVNITKICCCLHIIGTISMLLVYQCQQNHPLLPASQNPQNYLVLVGLSVIWCRSHEKYHNLLKHWIVTAYKSPPLVAGALSSSLPNTLCWATASVVVLVGSSMAHHEENEVFRCRLCCVASLTSGERIML